MGIETLVLKKHRYSQGLTRKKNIDYGITSIIGRHNNDDNFQCISSRHILSNKQILQNNSRLLCYIVNEISLNSKIYRLNKNLLVIKESWLELHLIIDTIWKIGNLTKEILSHD